MCKMLVLYRGETSTISSFRQDFPAMVASVGIEVEFCDISDLSYSRIRDADSVMLVRVSDPAVVSLVKRMKVAGYFVIAFYDDDLLNLPESLPSIGYQKRALIKILKLSDAILTSSPKIRDMYREISGTRSYLIHTSVSEETIGSIPYWERKDDQISIAYAAGSAHAGNIEKYIVPILSKLGERYGSRIRLEFVGVRPRIKESYGMNIVFTDGMPIGEYREYMRRSRFDLGLAVLEADPFSECKYFNKYIEYTIVGTVGLYSNCKPYTYAIEDGVNGFLVENTTEKWFEKLCYAIDNRSQIAICKNNAIEGLKARHNIETISAGLIHDMPEILECRDKETELSLRKFKAEDAFYVLITRLYHYGWHMRKDGWSWIKSGINKKLSLLRKKP